MKIAYICQFYEPVIGGVEEVIRELATRMAKKGHEVHVFTSDFDKAKRIKAKEEIIDGVHVHRFPYLFALTQFAPFWPSLLWNFKGEFDIIHVHVFGHPFTFIGSLLAKISKTPLVITTHCPWTDKFRRFIVNFFIFFSYNLNRFSFKWADKIIAITPWEISFIEKYGGNKNKIEVIPNGVNKILFKKIFPNTFKKKHKIKGKIALFFGRFNVTKGPDKLALAAKEILKERKDIYFVFVGPDEGVKKEVKNIAKGEKNMIILDPIKDRKKVAEMYQAADVYMLPSYREGLPLTLFEAMASGLPIIASPVNGVPYEMKEPENGFFVKYGNIQGLREKILEIIDNPSLAHKISKNNIKKAKNYDWEIIFNKTLKIYKKLFNQK
jgi:glycosyltransferase involved in cell wall biosynthesis